MHSSFWVIHGGGTIILTCARVRAIDDLLRGVGAHAWTAVIMNRTNREILHSITDTELRQQVVDLEIEAIGSTPQTFQATIEAEIAKWARVVKASSARIV